LDDSAPKTENALSFGFSAENDRLRRLIDFILEVDRLKSVFRKTYLADGSRLENAAEHSWHVGLAALLLRDVADDPIDMDRTLKILLVHDLVEIEAGDTYCYDETGVKDQAARERAAADRLFTDLPEETAGELRTLWEEYEAGETPEACFAGAVDRLVPLLHNFAAGGKSWKENAIVRGQVEERAAPIRRGSHALWRVAVELIDAAVNRGYLAPGEKK
jgi:putative hydrolase of HD superfamily